MHPYAYLLENVPPLGDSQLVVFIARQEIKASIGELMQVDVVIFG
jgi:hypothetical protein